MTGSFTVLVYWLHPSQMQDKERHLERSKKRNAFKRKHRQKEAIWSDLFEGVINEIDLKFAPLFEATWGSLLQGTLELKLRKEEAQLLKTKANQLFPTSRPRILKLAQLPLKTYFPEAVLSKTHLPYQNGRTSWGKKSFQNRPNSGG